MTCTTAADTNLTPCANRFTEHVFRSNPFGHRRLVDRLLVDDRGSPDLGVRAQPRTQPLERHVSGAGELGGRWT